jgi:lipopolysaccharide transport system permease protein
MLHYKIIKRKKGWQFIDFSELKNYRDLFYFLIVRQVQIRYKQSVLGGIWAIVQPLFLMVIFSLFFGKLAGLYSEGIPYPIFNFSAMVCWTYFSNTVTSATNSLVENSSLVSKVYFPRSMMPLAPVIAGLLDFAIAFMVLIAMMLYYHIYPGITIFFIFILIIPMILTASGIGTMLSALNAKYRDIKALVPLLIQVWMFISPVVYSVTLVPVRYRVIYALNPMAGVIEGFRTALLKTGPFPTQMFISSFLVSIILFVTGIFYFRQAERHFADVI